ncbi:NUDIX domain-containing protein [Catellatospora aurea]|uniref:NUDIX domain-containing protein n=1 Tax=Catellatospora aurea TaxID=1337874 RepID=A0ABW2H623_9ACTN
MAWVEPEIWYRSLPTFYAAADVLVTDEHDRLLLVKPNYRDHWAFPGGMIEAGEPPHVAAARELTEEIGLKIELGGLLVVDWAPPMGHRPSAIMYFLFDGGSVSSGITVDPDAEEIERAAFFPLAECVTLLPAHTANRATAAMAARASGRTAYLPVL